MADDRPACVDEAVVREHMEEVIESHEQAFETFFFARFLGLNFEYLPAEAPDADKEVCRLTFEVTDMLRNPQGSLHGGVMASAMDISMGHLVNKIAGAGATIELKVQFMRPVMEGLVTCEGRFTKKGRSLSFMESRLMGPDGKLAALATATWKMPG
ncbi:thioesterase [Thalassobacter stenotrophicus]|uniref:PaaI family thioesterase n=1 Tax=Thalassobacter stenotrophicus TaxID=266809 RepID=UPI00051FD6F0|nr:PaaI family thioesterase [Thalassobacter stenotrophicus]KGK78991.1 thioesterase [Thalassobacter stenotrophicus]